MIKVSVIVPVYNPGSNVDDCIRSLLGQSLPSDEYELIFVDDGSTDETPARLDALAAEHANVQVEHIPNSGWPGRPRNLGIEMAHGEYVYFVDNDDWMDPEALERLYENATRHGSDIVIGKVVGHGHRVPRQVFQENQDSVDLEWRPLLYLLTPHKLFRRAFLDEHGLRFPEGRRRLEDHVLVMHAYFHAKRISVLADHPIYHWVVRDDAKSNASKAGWDPVGYFENVREVLDIVEEHTEPGPLRDRLMSHWYRGKMLKRLGGPRFMAHDEAYRRLLYGEIAQLAGERFGPEHEQWLPFNLRVRARLLRDDAYDALMRLGRWEYEMTADVTVRGSRVDGSALVLSLDGTLHGFDGPMTFSQRGDRVIWEPSPILGVSLPEGDRDVTDEVTAARLEVVVRSLRDRADFLVPVEQEVRIVGSRVVVAGEARIDPATAAAGRPLAAGDWEVIGVVWVGGYTSTALARRHGLGTAHELNITIGGDGPPEMKWIPMGLAGVRRRFARTRAVGRARRAVRSLRG